MTTPILLVEDNRDDIELTLAFCAEVAPHLVFQVATTGTECRSALATTTHQPFAAIVLDYTLPDSDGLALLQEIVESDYPAPVVIVTGRNNVETAVEAMKAGAMDYLVKSSNHWEHVPRVIEAAITRYRLIQENQRLQHTLELHTVELELAARKAQFEQERLLAVIDQLPEGVIIFGEDGQAVAANRAAEGLWGHEFIPVKQIVEYGQYRLENLDGSLRSPENTTAARVLRTGQPLMGEQAVIVQPNGKRITVLVNAAPLLDGDSNVIGAVVVFQDISEMKQLERLKDEILSIASHELKNPLTVIMGYSSLLKRTPAVEHDTRASRAADTIRQQTLRMRRLIERLLDLSRLDLGRMVLQIDSFDVAALLRTIAEEQQSMAPKHQVHTVLEQNTFYIDGDYTRLEQVLVNLVNNAIKYSPNGGDVELSLMVRQEVSLPNAVAGSDFPQNGGPFALIQVCDPGIGIAPEAQRQLFTRFYRSKEAAHIASGQGLGLYISAEIVRMHGGVICAESVPGKGSTFSVVLPVTSPVSPVDHMLQ